MDFWLTTGRVDALVVFLDKGEREMGNHAVNHAGDYTGNHAQKAFSVVVKLSIMGSLPVINSRIIRVLR